MASVDIYTRDWCGFCTRAKRLLEKKGVAFVEYNASRDPSKRDEMIVRSGGQRTFPQIFIGGVHVGGCDELIAFDRSGKLDDALQGSDA